MEVGRYLAWPRGRSPATAVCISITDHKIQRTTQVVTARPCLLGLQGQGQHYLLSLTAKNEHCKTICSIHFACNPTDPHPLYSRYSFLPTHPNTRVALSEQNRPAQHYKALSWACV